MPRLASGGSPPAARYAAGPRTRRDGDIAPYRHYTRMGRTRHYTRKIRTRHYPGGAMIARGGSPPAGPPGRWAKHTCAIACGVRRYIC